MCANQQSLCILNSVQHGTIILCMCFCHLLFRLPLRCICVECVPVILPFARCILGLYYSLFLFCQWNLVIFMLCYYDVALNMLPCMYLRASLKLVLEVELLAQGMCLSLTSLAIARSFSSVVQTSALNSTLWEFLLFCILANPWYCQIFGVFLISKGYISLISGVCEHHFFCLFGCFSYIFCDWVWLSIGLPFSPLYL